jgi:multiple sugar transport system substrate-binding protein
MESVMTGQQTPEEAAAVYDEAVIGIVGEENTTQG